VLADEAQSMRRDLMGSIALLGIAAGYFFLTTRINTSALADEVGAQGLPRVYAALLALMALGLGARALRGRRTAATTAQAEPGNAARTLRRAAGVIAIGILYLLILPLAGYLIATALLLAAMLRYLGEPLRWRVAATALLGAAFLWALFDRVLGIAMPGPYGL